MSDPVINQLTERQKVRLRAPRMKEEILNLLQHGSLYKVVPVELAQSLEALYPLTILLYCTTCKAERPFRDSIPIRQKIYPTDKDEIQMLSGVYPYDYECTACGLTFYCWILVNFEQDTVEKIGQKPSIADLYSGELAKYRRVLKDKYSEFTKAVGLHTHGVGVGAFVYLRRIFEGLVTEAYAEAGQEPGWDEGAYQRARMDEKIVLLKNYLPQTLVGNAGMYAILSRGIHSLSEDDCLKYFNTIRLGVELILDEKIEREERQKKLKRVADELSTIKGGQANE